MPRLWWWVGFNALVLCLLAIDLGVINRKSRAISVRQALGWTSVWVSLAVLFGIGIGATLGRQPMLEFFAGYLVEEALSVDNLFVFILIFGYFRIAPSLQHRVLFWGIIGALVMRGTMIITGAALVARFQWILYVFGAFLVITAIRMALSKDTEIDPATNPVLRLMRRLLPVTADFHGDQFFVREAAPRSGQMRLSATPLFLVLVLAETTDVLFALDSIPAIFGVTRDPFLIYTSNVFAILGLRSLYFVLAGVIGKFHLLKYGLAMVLAFVGAKMLLSEVYPISIGPSLLVVFLILVLSILLSLVIKPEELAVRDAPADQVGD